MNDQVALRNQLLDILHRGGAYGYWWTDHGRESVWWPTSARAPLPVGKINLYFGVHPTALIPQHTYGTGPRKGQAKPAAETRAHIEDVSAINCLFAEFDAKDYGSKEAAFAHVTALSPSASAVVDSGGGYHAYWLLYEPFCLNSEDARDRADHLQARWVGWVGGDKAAKDLARVLRVPGTKNFKDKYAPDYPVVRVEWLEDARYTLDELAACLPAEPERQPSDLILPPLATLSDDEVARRRAQYAASALQSEAVRVSVARAGERNHTLLEAAIKLGSLVGAQALQRADVEQALSSAGRAAGLAEDEITHTVGNGLEYGLARPREIRLTERNGNGHTNAFDFVAPAAPAVKSNGNGHSQTAAAPAPTPPASGPLPGVQINNRQLREISSDVLDILARAGHDQTRLFVRGGLISRVITDERQRASIDIVREAGLAGILTRAANFFSQRQDANGSSYQRAENPPQAMVRDIIELGQWPFPPIDGIIESPILRADGSVLDTPGYDPSTTLYYAPAPDLDFQPIPAEPSRYEIEQALQLISDVVCDFPFVNAASRANWLGLFMTPILRYAIRGHVPMALIDATGQGTGKTMLSELISLLAAGADPTLLSMPYTGEEWAKTITTSLLAGRSVIVLDNVGREIFADELAQVLTADTWTCRILGVNREARVTHRATWIANGNNIKVRGDFSSRCYWIRLDAGVSRAWEREGFRHADVKNFVRANRGRLISAVLTMARGWFLAGQPRRQSPLQMRTFTEWARIVGGILEFAGEAAFLTNANEFYDMVDEETPQWETFLLGLQDRFGDKSFTVAQICQAVAGDVFNKDLLELVPATLGEPVDDHGNIRSGFKHRLGKALAKRVDTRFGDSQIYVAKGDVRPNSVVKWVIRAGKNA